MEGDSTDHYYCIKEPRCGLCLFRIEDEERVVAAIKDDHVSSTFLFGQSDTFAEGGIQFHLCSQSYCSRRCRQVHCFHIECYSAKLLPTTSKFFAATEYSFSPPIRKELQRRSRIQHTLANKLKLYSLSPLPWEICYMVVGHLVRQSAIHTAQQLALDVCASNSLVDLSRDVYAQYVRIEGVLYVRSLYNSSSSEDKSGEVQVFKPCQGRVVRSIYIRYDHLGIRDICFALPKDDLLNNPVCGIWWTELSREDGILQVAAKTDGLKLRCLLDSADYTPEHDDTMPAPGWPTPGLTCRVVDLDTCRTVQEALDGMRMDYMDCNRPDTEGYTAAIRGYYISKLYAHQSDTRTRLYEELDSCCNYLIFLYMPIDQDEYIKEIWGICAGARFSSLMVLTSLGRAVIFGPYLAQPLEFHLLYATTNRPSRIYFNEWNSDQDDICIRYLGVDTKTEPDMSLPHSEIIRRSQYPPMLYPVLPAPSNRATAPWHYTHCRMENVAEITCCINRTIRHNPIIGMLLRYENGRRACLGQYRMDWAADPIIVDRARGLRIGLSDLQVFVERFLYVAEVGFQGLTDSGPSRWVDVPWHGKLEWWFSPLECDLRHSD